MLGVAWQSRFLFYFSKIFFCPSVLCSAIVLAKLATVLRCQLHHRHCVRISRVMESVWYHLIGLFKYSIFPCLHTHMPCLSQFDVLPENHQGGKNLVEIGITWPLRVYRFSLNQNPFSIKSLQMKPWLCIIEFSVSKMSNPLIVSPHEEPLVVGRRLCFL